MNSAQFIELLLQSLEHERGGVKVYTAALKCARRPDLQRVIPRVSLVYGRVQRAELRIRFEQVLASDGIVRAQSSVDAMCSLCRATDHVERGPPGRLDRSARRRCR